MSFSAILALAMVDPDRARERVRLALFEASGSIPKASKALGVTPVTLRSLLAKHEGWTVGIEIASRGRPKKKDST